MTGVHWSGAVHDWRLAPREYGAIHFHSDDIYDCGWPATLVLDVPLDWRSGVPALRLRPPSTPRPVDAAARHAETFITFFVTPAAGAHNLRTARPRAQLVLLAPSMTYMAYANSALRLHAVHFEVLTERLLMLTGDDVYLQEHPEIGQSTYDHHIDGSGRAYSSWLRPVLNMRPRATPGNLAIDTHFIDWLEEKGIDYDLITDAELDRQGLGAIAGYRVLATLSHPEYYSQAMMNAIMAYQNGGGRHLALGANGFYWRCAWHPQAPAAVEVRRGISGTRTWESRPGEVHLAGTGEPGALWRHSGFAPQKLIGVGFAAMVYDHAGYYLLTPEATNPRVAFALQGIAQGERIGDYGVRAGGAVGIEIDRFDADLGSPPHAVILARSHGLGPGALPTPEEYRTTVHGLDAEQNALVRADMVFFETARGGAVFATGSIAYMLSLSHNGYDNDVSRITPNLLRRFLHPPPLTHPHNGAAPFPPPPPVRGPARAPARPPEAAHAGAEGEGTPANAAPKANPFPPRWQRRARQSARGMATSKWPAGGGGRGRRRGRGGGVLRHRSGLGPGHCCAVWRFCSRSKIMRRHDDGKHESLARFFSTLSLSLLAIPTPF